MSFAARLKKARVNGSMTTADLSVWFDRPYPTIRSWLEGREPWGPNGDVARAALDTLEKAVTRRSGFPVPVHLSPVGRKRHMRQARHEHLGANSRVPRTRSA